MLAWEVKRKVAYTIGEVAQLSGVTVRALRHYDEIGLLKPSFISPSGYRMYEGADLERLQQILFFKEFGFPLSEIQRILDNPDFDRAQALESQRTLLLKEIERLERMLQTLDRTLDALKGGGSMSAKEMFDGFDMSEIEAHIKEYADEARARWGKAAVDPVIDRTSQYPVDRWAGIQRDWDAIFRTLADAMEQGPDHPDVQASVANLRKLISDHFYDCTLEIFRGLGDLYVHDKRFTARIDAYRPGLATFLRQAIHIYCDRFESAQD